MVNFREDTEHEENYEIGWEWIEEDTGPYIAPYTGFQQSSWSNQKQPWRFLRSFVHVTYVHDYGWRNEQIRTEKNSER